MPEPGRRRFLRIAAAAGMAPPLLAVLDGTAHALPPGERADLAILHASLTLEHHAIALYERCLRDGLVPAGLRGYAVEFNGDHVGHRDTQVALSLERGGRPPVARDEYDFGVLHPGDDAVRRLHEIELAARDAYLALVSRIGTTDYLSSAAYILADEVRHLTVWSRALGLRIY